MASAPYVPSVPATLSKIDAALQHLEEGRAALQSLRTQVVASGAVTPHQATVTTDLLAASAATSRALFAL